MIARIQNALCWLPRRAAQPTQNVPTTKTTCVRTRSISPSSFLKTALRASTSRSSSVTVGEVVVGSVFIGSLLDSQYFSRSGATAQRDDLSFVAPLRRCGRNTHCLQVSGKPLAIGPHLHAFRE